MAKSQSIIKSPLKSILKPPRSLSIARNPSSKKSYNWKTGNQKFRRRRSFSRNRSNRAADYSQGTSSSEVRYTKRRGNSNFNNNKSNNNIRPTISYTTSNSRNQCIRSNDNSSINSSNNNNNSTRRTKGDGRKRPDTDQGSSLPESLSSSGCSKCSSLDPNLEYHFDEVGNVLFEILPEREERVTKKKSKRNRKTTMPPMKSRQR